MGTPYDAIILGAGIAGSGMAGALAARGWRTLLLDRGTFPKHKACGEFLSPESKISLAWLGFDPSLGVLRPAVIDQVRLIAAGGARMAFPLPDSALGLSRFALDEALRASAADKGAEIRSGVTVHGISRVPEGYLVEATGGGGREMLCGRAAIGAWGRQRRVELTGGRQAAGDAWQIGRKTQLEGLEATTAVELYLFAGGYAGVAPVEDGRVNVAAVLNARLARTLDLRGSEWLRSVAALHPALADRLSGGRPVPGTDQSASPVRPTREPVAWGIVPHVGDAAIVVPPLCGDGMAMALRSVERCAPLADDYLRGAVSLAGWREAYERALRRDFRAPARWGSLLQAALTRPLVSSALLRLGARAPAAAVRLFQATRPSGAISPG
ncbi:NAD(P)/FAD-dependent oxidoreductase [Cohnella nanjingensis]|uniref:NAD(P)/FAD-dependent oxidoreductase n=1 Tax=Cohnella nanjingensis TaxID=1387779 RepID=A0A7X0RUJ2_9BACL|nr:NAD(P)/FAD-dependent oxidoreductase [Cohnella nanjingensis]MBB6672751.1 NAD(P)/FAD-dependent oxidoreductase [Cohnella nanjingensis]